MRKIFLAFLLMMFAASFVAADTIFLRDGRTVRGTVLGYINGRFAVRISSVQNNTSQTNTQTNTQANTRPISNTEGEIVFFRPREIERIEIDGRSLDEARYQTRSVEVALGPNWVDSGVDLRRGQRVQVTASGTILTGRSRITPGGLRQTDPNAPLPRAAEGVLIGAVSNDPNAPIIEIGLSREFVADRDGRLYLTANRSNYTDARGAFNAQIRTEMDFGRSVANNRDDNYDDRNQDNNQYDPLGNGTSRSDPAPTRPRNNPDQTNSLPPVDNRSPREKIVNVAATSQGTDTGIDLRSGDQVTITAAGNITAGRRAGVVSADGGRQGFGSVVGTYPLASAGVGALIGYIRLNDGRTTQPFLVGTQATFNAPVDGRLFLFVNDDNYSDNSGNFSVKIVY